MLSHCYRFVVPKTVETMFVNSWRQREQDMRQFDGFVDFKMEQDGDKYVVSSRCVCA
jgi:heme-degrading monooxygenase HmoA